MNTFSIRTIPNKKYVLYVPLDYVSDSGDTPESKHVLIFIMKQKKVYQNMLQKIK